MRGTEDKRVTGVLHRVSTADQSTEAMKIAVGRYLMSIGVSPQECRVYEDFASGVSDNRPFRNQLFEDINAGLIKRVVVWRLDRLGRSVSDLVKCMEFFRKHDCEFVSVVEGMDTATSHGRLLYNIMASMAEFERELIRERCILSIKKRKALGLPIGRGNNPDRKPRKKDGYFRREAKKREERQKALVNLLGSNVDVVALKELIKKDKLLSKKALVNDTKV